MRHTKRLAAKGIPSRGGLHDAGYLQPAEHMRFHHQIITILMTVLQAVGCAPALKDATAEPASVSWFDDYFTIEYIDPTTIAIGEPRYHQQNYSYLIVGETRAVLFDTGPGVRSIKPVVDSLTTLPVIITQSHLHYDHIGGHHLFGGAALPDLPYLRGRVQSGNLQVKLMEHLGLVEGFRAPSLEVSEWWSDDSAVDLGGRALTVVHAPGHTKDSNTRGNRLPDQVLPRERQNRDDQVSLGSRP